MGSAFVDTQTYSRVIGEAEDAHVYVEGVDRFEIELRPLDAGDRAKIRDALALESQAGGVGLALGTVELLHVRQALVSWTLPTAATATTIERLQPAVLEAIRELVAWGKIPPPPLTKRERDLEGEQKVSSEATEALERHRVDLEEDELRDGEEPGSVPLASSSGAAGAVS